jgi:hypothetical protein
MGNRESIERLARALAAQDLDAQVAEMHPDFVCRYPQSGEVIRGRDNYRGVAENYPGTEGRGIHGDIKAIVGTDDAFVRTASVPSWSVIHLAGSGDDFTATGTIAYPNGETWHVVVLCTMLEGLIWRMTMYFAPPFEMPEWRRPFVELEEPASG